MPPHFQKEHTQVSTRTSSPPPERVLRAPVSLDCDCELILHGKPSAAGFRKLMLYIELIMEAWGPESSFPHAFNVVEALMKWRAIYDEIASDGALSTTVAQLTEATTEVKARLDIAFDALVKK